LLVKQLLIFWKIRTQEPNGESGRSRAAPQVTSPLGWVRRPSGRREKAADLDAGLRPALLALVEPDTREDPMSPPHWTTKSNPEPGRRADPR
jgi:hypothetical protein